MLKGKVIVLAFSALLIIAMMHRVNAQPTTRIYRYYFANLEVWIEYPFEEYPNKSITIKVATRALSTLLVNYTKMDLYTLHNYTREEEKFYSIIHVTETEPKQFFANEWLNRSYQVFIPDYAINLVYGKLMLKWTLAGTGEAETYEREITVLMSYLKNLELERLRNENAILKENLTALNSQLVELNNTIIELSNNLTEIKSRYEGELSGTRSTIVVLAVITVFFVATTAYLILRKPKQVW